MKHPNLAKNTFLGSFGPLVMIKACLMSGEISQTV